MKRPAASVVADSMPGPGQATIEEQVARQSTVWEKLLVLLFYSLITVAISYPIIPHLRDHVIGAYAEDNLHFVWELWYAAHALFDLHKSPFFDPDVYYPYGFSLIKNQDLSPATVLLFAPLTRLIGEVATFNLLILASFVLTAFGAYLLAFELWGSRAGALLAGLIIGFCPYRFAHAGGHLSIASTQWILFFFLYLERLLRKPRARSAILAGTFFALSALVTWYYFFMVPLVALFYIGFRIRWRDLRHFREILKWGVVSIAVSLVFILPFLIPYYLATHEGILEYRGPGESQAFAAAMADFLIPPTPHPLWGAWVAGHWRKGANGLWLSEWQLYLGLTSMTIACIGIFHPRREVVVPLIALSVAAFIFSLGPGLYWTHPPRLSSTSNDVALSPIPMPGILLRQLPGFENLRAWARLGFFVQVGAGLLAAAGLSLALTRLHLGSGAWGTRAVIFLACGLTALDLAEKPFGMSPVQPRPVDKWLAQQPGKFSIMEYPVPNHGYGGRAIYSTRWTGKRIVLGSAQAPPNLFSWGILSLFPSPSTLDLLASWEVKYVLVDEDRYRYGSEFWGLLQTWETLAPAIHANGRLKEVASFDGVHVYALLSENYLLAGEELLSNPGFEGAVDPQRPDDWIVIGQPVLDSSGRQSLVGARAVRVSEDNYFVSEPVKVEAGQCYMLRMGIRAVEQQSSSRLQLNWFDISGLPLASTPAIIHVVAANPKWQTAQLEVVAPEDAAACRVYTAAQRGQVWLDEYSLRKLAGTCPPELMAVPNPVLIDGDHHRTVVVWDSHRASQSQIYLSIDDRQEEFFAEGESGAQPLENISPGSRYQFRLYESHDHRLPIQLLEVHGKNRAPQLEVNWPTPTGSGSPTLTWRTSNGLPARIYISKDGGAEMLFAEAPVGTETLQSIEPESNYEFRLYTEKSKTRPAEIVTIPAVRK